MTQLAIDARLAERARGRKPSPIRAIFPLLSIPGMISFGGGYPNPVTFPLTGITLDLDNGKQLTIPAEQMGKAQQYGPSDGAPFLLDHLLEWHKSKDGKELNKDSLVVLNGSQEGLFIAGYLFLDADDSVALSEPTYPGALSAFAPFTSNYLPVPLDENGMNTVVLEQELKQLKDQGAALPKLVYVIPSGHNPGGVALSSERRRHLLEIARQYDLLILEDDPYQLVRLNEASPPTTLQSLDTDGRVIRLDSFSKILAPGLRLGYASGHPDLIRHFVLYKQCANLHTSSLTQQILAAYLGEVGPEGFQAQIREKCRAYRENRDRMIQAVKKWLPEEVRFNVPGEGLFIWFELPDYCDATRMVESYARELKVVLVPGPAFSTRGGCQNCMRASFSMVSHEQIDAGIQAFAEMIKREKAI